MLWNKMRLLVILGLLCLFATTQASAQLTVVTGGTQLYFNEAKKFFIMAKAKDTTGSDAEIINGILPAASGKVYGQVNNKDTDYSQLWPDLRDLLRTGGFALGLRIPTQAEVDVADAAYTLKPDLTAAEALKYKHHLVVTEVMWGRDNPSRARTDKNPQWIEFYCQGVLKKDDVIRWRSNTNHDALPAPGEIYTDGDRKTVALDVVTTFDQFDRLWQLKGSNGDTDGNTATGAPPMDMVSMYRKINLDTTGKAYALKDGKLDGLGDGSEPGSWAASEGRINMTGNYVGSPGSVHVPFGGADVVKFNKNPAAISDTGIIINEVRNDTSSANLDWIELFYNSNDASDPAVNIENYELSLVMGKMKDDGSGYHESGDANFTDTSLAVLPKYRMKPGEYLVVYNRDPGKSVKLAGGTNLQDILDKTDVKTGTSHKYVVAKDLKLPAEGKFLILLRTRNHADDVGKPTNIKDYAGNGFFKRMEDRKFNTDVWPFVAWAKPGDVDDNDFGGMNTFASRSMSFGRDVMINSQGMYGAKSRENRVHKDDWKSFGFMGAGYDRGKDKDIDTTSSPGTPGYPNMAVNEVSNGDYTFDGKVTISEVMYDAGPRWNLMQWIELYNSSMTETVNLAGWELEIRNKATDQETYVDTEFTFDAETYIPPNQTLLLVSSSGANDVPPNYVYNLLEKHRSDLGLTTSGRRLLSAESFYLELRAKVNGGDPMVMDTAGNLKIDGAMTTKSWDLPERGEVRTSIVRTYGGVFNDMAAGSGPNDADDGLMKASWRKSDLTLASFAFYGHRSDIGTPGYRLGSPLPVSLSSFRPVRNASTGHVEITWVTQSELNNAGFNILRSESKTGEFAVINTKGLIAGHGTTSEKHVYTYTDTAAKPNVVYYYQIEDVSMDGVRTTLRTTHLRGDVSASGKLTTRWGELKSSDK